MIAPQKHVQCVIGPNVGDRCPLNLGEYHWYIHVCIFLEPRMHEMLFHAIASKPVASSTNFAADDAIFARIIPLWIGREHDGVTRPSLIFGSEAALISASTPNPCDGLWQLQLFSFSYEARQALQTVRLLCPSLPSEAAPRPTGEGLLLLKVADGPFDCSIIDRRGSKGIDRPLGSWEVPHAVARQAVYLMPTPAWGRARQAARHIVSELCGPAEKAELCAQMGCKNRLDERPYGQIRLEDVVAAANGLLETAGVEINCSDKQVLSFIDAYISAAPFEISGIVDRIALDLVAELAEQRCLG